MNARDQASEHPYRVRWAVNVGAWQPTAREFSSALDALPSHEHAGCLRFLHEQDRKRALVSRLLQRRFGCQALGVQTLRQVPIERTERGKPFFRPLPALHDAPNLNFNVSHEVCAGSACGRHASGTGRPYSTYPARIATHTSDVHTHRVSGAMCECASTLTRLHGLPPKDHAGAESVAMSIASNSAHARAG